MSKKDSDFQTPLWVCRLMVSRIFDNPKRILEPTPGRGNLVRVLASRFPSAEILTPEDFWSFPVTPVDWVVANPPFSHASRLSHA